jgi:pimeloyl-ACP methyl ester carboxylesterase
VILVGFVDANGTSLYYERGQGPVVLLISGATGDAGHWTQVAGVLGSQYTVVTYDRRGNSRSPRPRGWRATTINEQADDAAALLAALHLDRAAVLGTSAAAGIVANLALRHPGALRGVIFHEPLFESGVTNPDAVRAARRAVIEEGTARGGARGAAEAFLRNVGGDEVYDALDPRLRERLLGNAEVLLDIAAYPAYGPTPDELASLYTSRVVTAGAANRTPDVPGHWRYESAQCLATRLATELIELPGGHMGYLSQPRRFAEALGPVVRMLG